MYAGHVGVALGAKGLRSSLPLWVLIIASQLPDWTDATFCLAGIRAATPGMLSHSLPAIGLLTLGGALIYFASTRDVTGASIVAALVVSHALGDYVTGLKPTWDGGPLIGLRLYQHPAFDFVLEAAVVLIGWMIYRKSFPPERRSSRELFSMLTLLLALQLFADLVFSLSPSLRKC